MSVEAHASLRKISHYKIEYIKLQYYYYPSDKRYMGCFNENPDSPDLPVSLWGPYEGRSVDDCITECSQQGFNYSGKIYHSRNTCWIVSCPFNSNFSW